MRVALSSARLAALSALLLILGIAAIAFTAYVFLSGHESATRAQHAGQQAQLLAGQLQAFVKQHQLLAQRIATRAAETGLLQDKKAVDRAQPLAQLSLTLPSALKLRLLPVGAREPDGSSPELSYVCFDQIERLTRGEKNVAAEVHLAGSPSAHMDFPAVIHDPESKDVLGHVLLSLDPAAVRDSLGAFQAEHGFVELRQVAGSDSLVIASAGQAVFKTGEPASKLNIAGTGWWLNYWPATASWSPDTIELSVGGGAALLGLLSLLAAVVLPRRWLATTLREDAETFSTFFNDVRTGVLMGSYPFRLNEFNALAKQLRSSGEAIIQDRRQLEQRTQNDALTGVASRAHFEQKLEQLHQQARLGLSSAMMVTDIDHLEQINTDIGTEAGDILLKQFARQLREALRTGDTVARLEGGRFATLFPFTDLEKIQPVVERLRQRLTEQFDPGTGMPRAFSWSAGLTLISKDDPDMAVILARCEAGLKSAQNNGGNQTVTHMPPA
jgi:diguanylate cyclase (GGDEF)-like protein